MREKLIEMLKENEGLRLIVYKCPTGKLTIGYGRNLEDRGITPVEAEMLLFNDINIIENALKSYKWFNELDNIRQDAIINMVFNLGFKGFFGFINTIKYLEKKDFKKAAASAMQSKWAEQVGNRAKKIAYMIENGEYYIAAENKK